VATPEGEPSWAENVVRLLLGEDFERQIPIIRFPPIPTPWSRGSDVPWPELAVYWLTASDGPDAFWDACTAKADYVDVHLEFAAGGLPAAFATLPSAQRVYTTQRLTVILHPPPSGERVPANDALGTLLSTITDIVSNPDCQVTLVGIEFLDVPAEHPGLAGGQLAHMGETFRLMANARHWLSTFYRGRNFQDQEWLDHFDYYGTILPPIQDEFELRGCPGAKGSYGANLAEFVQDFWNWYTLERWEELQLESDEPEWYTAARLSRGTYPSQYFERQRLAAGELPAEPQAVDEVTRQMGALAVEREGAGQTTRESGHTATRRSRLTASGMKWTIG
jgi:hypothetical protein